MSVLCPRCDIEPVGPAAGELCPACGTKLVVVASGEPPDELIGATLDNRFAIVARLGRGGMGTVYRARQTSMDREVAVKLIDRELERDPLSVKRFFREAQLASKLAHPNTVSVIEFGQDPGGRLYIAMELVRGETLSALARRERALPVERIARLGVQLCDALEAAHAIGVVHRDLKLDNVMVLDGGRDLIKVLDFGLARSTIDPDGRATVTGMIAGTPRYLAPEVGLRAAEPDPAQDVYAIGVMLGELALGHELWSAPTMEALFASKAFVKVQLPGLEPRLAALIHQMLDPEPLARPSLAAIRDVLLALGGAARPSGPPDVTVVTPPPVMGVLDVLGVQSDVRSIATGPTDAALMQLRPSRIVALDQLPHATPTYPPRAFGGGLDLPPGGPPPLEDASASGSVAVPPAFTSPLPPSLEMDAEWSAARAAKQAAHVSPPIVKRRRAPALAIGLVVVIIGGGTLAVLARTSHHGGDAPAVNHDPPRATVDIHIVAPSPVEVRVDGARAGKTPLTLSYKRGASPLLVTSEVDGHTVTRQVTPDHDQTVDLDPD